MNRRPHRGNDRPAFIQYIPGDSISYKKIWFRRGAVARRRGTGRACRRGVGRRRLPARHLRPPADPDRKSVVEGKRVSVRVDLGGRRIIKKKKKKNKTEQI